MIQPIKHLIETLEKEHLSVNCIRDGEWNDFRSEFLDLINNDSHPNSDISHRSYWSGDYMHVIYQLRNILHTIKTSFIASTATGVFLHFVGKDHFPEELFRQSDEGLCRVYYDRGQYANLSFWLEIVGDEERRRFYFTPPESLDQAALYGINPILHEKEVMFKVLNVNIQLSGITRNLILRIDKDWLGEMHNNMWFDLQ